MVILIHTARKVMLDARAFTITPIRNAEQTLAVRYAVNLEVGFRFDTATAVIARPKDPGRS